MRSTDGPLESVMIRCPAGHSFTGPIDVLVPKRTDGQDPGRPARRALPAKPDRNARRPNTAPAYYLGHPASLWIAAMRPRRKLVSAYPGRQ